MTVLIASVVHVHITILVLARLALPILVTARFSSAFAVGVLGVLALLLLASLVLHRDLEHVSMAATLAKVVDVVCEVLDVVVVPLKLAVKVTPGFWLDLLLAKSSGDALGDGGLVAVAAVVAKPIAHILVAIACLAGDTQQHTTPQHVGAEVDYTFGSTLGEDRSGVQLLASGKSVLDRELHLFEILSRTLLPWIPADSDLGLLLCLQIASFTSFKSFFRRLEAKLGSKLLVFSRRKCKSARVVWIATGLALASLTFLLLLLAITIVGLLSLYLLALLCGTCEP